MSLQLTSYVLAGLGLLVVVLTRVRLRKERAAGRSSVSGLVLNLHTVTGLAGLVLWIVYVAAPEDSTAGSTTTGIVALALLWVTAGCGLLILMRWLPTRGRHASSSTEDSWGGGPGLSVLAHLGMVGAVFLFTVSYMLGWL